MCIFQDRHDRIHEASALLTAGAINAIDFLNRIFYNDQKLRESLCDFSHVETVAPTEIDLFDFEVEAELRSQQSQNEIHVPPHMNAVVVIEPLQMQPNANDNSSEDSRAETPPPRDGMCIICLSTVSNVLYLDCKHMATCEACHLRMKDMHVENCHRWFAENERKLNRELNRVRCPKCNVAYNRAEIIFINSFN